jgi:hypothetical protein
LDQISTPRNLDEFDGYFKGYVRITKASNQAFGTVGSTAVVSGRILSLDSTLVYGASVTPDGKLQNVTAVSVCNVIPIDHLINQALSDMPASMIQLAKTLVSRTTVAVQAKQVEPLLQLLHTSFFRLPRLYKLWPFALPSQYDTTDELMRMPTEHILAMSHRLRTVPWTLVWYSPMQEKYGLPHPLLEKQYYAALRVPGVPQPPQYIEIALRIYFRMWQERKDTGDTAFLASRFISFLPSMDMMPAVMTYLQENDVRIISASSPMGGGGDLFCLARDLREAKRTLEALALFQANSLGSRHEPELRGVNVPEIPPTLTDRQAEIARHIQTHWLTIVEGMPGTGKTALITWVFSHYKRVMLTSFVGMMVKSLRKRNGRRSEAAYTIHHLLAQKQHRTPEESDLWFSYFEVLVVDEFSNVSMSLFSQLVRLFPNVSKVVFVGDHRQLKPIDCGDPMGDLLQAYGSLELHDNLRVEPSLIDLQQAPALIATSKGSQAKFTGKGPLRWMNKGQGLEPVFREILSMPRGHSILNTHIVALINGKDHYADGRNQINQECERMWIKLGVLKPPANNGGGIQVRFGVRLYPGCKITFTQNYNSPISVKFPNGLECNSDPVANGELVIVKSIHYVKPPGRGILMTVVDSEDPNDDPEYKTVWIDVKHGVKPQHVDLGYATTAYKTQGREFPYVIFWNQTNAGDQWTRASAYVAVSRGKECVWVAGSPQDFYKVCSRVDPPRRTIMSHLLKQRPVENAPITHQVIGPLLKPELTHKMPSNQLCSLTMAEVVASLKKTKV